MLKQKEFLSGGALLARLLDEALGKGFSAVPDGSVPEACVQAFKDNDLVETCFSLFENDLNVSRTAEKLYMHRNTLIYRMAKLERLTGLNVRKFADAVTFIILYFSYVKGETV